MLGSILTFIGTFASNGAKVAASALSAVQRERLFRIPEHRLTISAQLDRLKGGQAVSTIDMQPMIDAQSAARASLDTALYDMDHLVDELRGIDLLTPEVRAFVGHAEGALPSHILAAPGGVQAPTSRAA